MANNVFAYVEKMLPAQVDKVFKRDSLTDILTGGEIKLDFLDAKTVKIFKLASTGLDDYARGGHGSTNARGSAQSTTETFTLSQERYSEIPLDKLDTIDDAEVVLGHLAKEFIRTKVVPEFDTYRFSKLASYTNTYLGNRVEEAISANTILGKFNTAFEWMANQEVPEEDQVIYVTPAVMALIRNSTELTRRLTQNEYKENVSFSIEKYEGRDIIVVPESRFYTEANLLTAGSNRGAIAPTSDSKVINFMVVSKKAPIIVKKLDFAKVYDSAGADGAYLGYVGYLLTNLYYHDLFVPDNKKVAIYCSVSNTSAVGVGTGVLVSAVKGGANGKTQIDQIISQPAGIIYDKIFHYTTDGTAPAIGSADSGAGTQVYLNTDFTKDASHNIFCLSYGGKVVAVSKDFTSLPAK